MPRISGLVAIGLLAMSAMACSSSGQDETVPAMPVDVRTARVIGTDLAERLEAGGVVVASESAVVSSRTIAPIAAVHVRAGDEVRAGDVLVTLDARDVAAQSRQAVAAVAAVEQALKQAGSDQAAAAADHTLATAWHKRIATLHARNSATAQELDEAAARLAAAAARLAGAAAAIDQAQARLTAQRAAAEASATTESFTIIRAPFAGLITERLTDPGNLATPGAPLLRIEASGRRRVDVRVDEARAGYVHPGDVVEVLLETPAAHADAIQMITGTVTEVERAVAADQRAFTVKVALPADATPRTGVFARVRFRGEARHAIVVPPDALRRQGQVTSVFVVRDDIARIRLVRTGVAEKEQVEVVAGLDAGEIVVTTPPPALVDGQRVKVVMSAPAPGAQP